MSVDADNPIVLKSVQESKNAVIAMALAGVFDPIIPALTQVISETATAAADAAAAAVSASAAAASAASADNVANQALALANSAVLDIYDSAVLQTDIARSIDFTGAGVAATSNINGDVTVAIPGDIPVPIQDEGTPIVAAPTAINFVGAGVTVTNDPAGVAKVTITSGGGGEANTASNVGAGEDIFKQKTGVDLEFKTLVAGTNITLTPGASTLTIDATGGGGGSLDVQEEGSTVVTGATAINAVGNVATVTEDPAGVAKFTFLDATSSNTSFSLVQRDFSGDFYAGTISASAIIGPPGFFDLNITVASGRTINLNSDAVLNGLTSISQAYITGRIFLQDAGSITLNSDNFVVGINNSALLLDSDSAVAADRTFTLQAPAGDGQLLFIVWVGATGAGELVSDSSTKLSATWNPTENDTLHLFGTNGVWYEVSRSVN